MVAIPDRQDTPYYYMIDDQDYQTFVWIRDNLDSAHERALLDPWKATAFAAVTGRSVYTRILAYPGEQQMKAYEFLQSGCSDTGLLRDHGISIIYAPQGCASPDLTQVRNGVYVLE